MMVNCANGVLSVAFTFAGNTMSALGRDVWITLQYDLQAARSQTLSVSADNTAIVIDNTRAAAAFLDSMAGAHQSDRSGDSSQFALAIGAFPGRRGIARDSPGPGGLRRLRPT